MVSPAAFDKPDLDRAPVGAGMYTVPDYRAGDRIVFSRYEGYWDPAAQGAAEIDYVLMGDSSTRLNGLRIGELDAAVIDPATSRRPRPTACGSTSARRSSTSRCT